MTAEVKKTEKKMSLAEFTQKFITSQRNVEKSKGVNTVYSHYNEALKAFCDKVYGTGYLEKQAIDVEWGDEVHHLVGALAIPHILAKEGKIALRPIKGGKGVQIFLPTELKTRQTANIDAIFAKMGITV